MFVLCKEHKQYNKSKAHKKRARNNTIGEGKPQRIKGMAKLSEREEKDRLICDSIEGLSVQVNGIELLAKYVLGSAEGKESEETSICATVILTLCEKLQMEIDKATYALRNEAPRPQED